MSEVAPVLAPHTIPVVRLLPRSVLELRYPSGSESLGHRLRTIRLDLQLQIKEVASALGMSEGTIIAWERRGVKPRDPMLARALQYYEVRGYRNARTLVHSVRAERTPR